MKKLLITGGTVFASRFAASYFRDKYEVYVLNRNTRKQVEGVQLIEGDRNALGDRLKGCRFDAVLDICAYTGDDITHLLNAIEPPEDYIMISSSAVYPETERQPFREDGAVGTNSIWGSYGKNKLIAEQTLRERMPTAYILRPPYLYGPMQNVYREPFVFECALRGRRFCIPKDGSMKLQFFHVEDLCRMMQTILEQHPQRRVFNVGNSEAVDVNTFVELCYDVAGAPLERVNINGNHNQRDYFSFYDYEYMLDVTEQNKLLGGTKPLREGLQESFDWYVNHPDDVVRKGYIDFIDSHFTALMQ